MEPNYYDMQRLSDVELLSLTFRESTDVQVVKSLLSRINTMEELLAITVEELNEIEGMEEGTAEQFTAAMELTRRIYSAPTRMPKRMNSPQEVADFLMPQMRYMDREVFKCLYLNHKNYFMFTETVSIGGLSNSIVDVRSIFKPAIKRSAAKIILSHNHPSGDPTPSHEDIEVTQKLIKAGNVLGILVLDHLIIGDNQWVSLVQSGHMDSCLL